MGKHAHVSKPQLHTEWYVTTMHNSIHKSGIMSQSKNYSHVDF